MHASMVECPSCRRTLASGMRFCGYCGGPLPEAAAEPEEDRRIVSVLFCDLVGFTPLSERLDPEDVREIQDAYFARMSAEIDRFGGRVEKYAGDAVLAVFGAPAVHEDDAERAVHCALAMQAALRPLAEETGLRHGVELALRIGVNTGEVVSGLREGGGRRDVAVTGDVVNTAARYQASAAPGGIMVGTETKRLAERSIRFGDRQNLTLKGKSAPVPGYPVLGARGRAERWEPREETPLVGRERELSEILARLQMAPAGGQVVMLEAEAGVGKSRLLAEALSRMTGWEPVRVVRAHCRSYGQELSLSLIADALRDLCGIAEDDTAEQIRSRLDLSIPAGEHREVARDVLGELLGLPVGASVLARASAQVRREALIEALDALLAAAARDTTLVLVLEDVHWADAASLEILAALLPRVAAGTMLVLLTRRPEGELYLPEGATVIRLEPLEGEDARDLARTVLGRNLSPNLEQHLEARAGGNPLFVEELLRALTEAGDLEERDGVMHLVSGAAGRLPSTLTEILLARLDRLDQSVRSLAQVGSVIGRSFALRLLAATVDHEERALELRLQSLQQAALAFTRWSQELEYVFKHALVREVVYGTLLMRRRRELHERVAHTLIALYPTGDVVEAVAYHLAQTDNWAESALWLERAGDRAAAMYANETALTHYEQARDRISRAGASQSELAGLDEKLGRIYFILARYEQALETLGRAAEAYARAGHVDSQGRVVAAMGLVYEGRATPADGLALLAGFIERHGGDDLASLGRVYQAQATLLTRTGRYEESLSAARLAMEHAQRRGDAALIVEAGIAQATALGLVSRLDDAVAVMEEVVPLAEGSNDRAIAFSAIMNLGGVYEEIGKIRECLACFQRGLEMSHQLGRPTAVASSLLNLARIHYRHGEWDRSREEMQEALAIFRRTGASSRLPAVLYSIGALSAFRGDWETLDRAMDEARTWVNAMGDVALLRWIEGFAAQGDILRGRPDAARDRLLPLLDRGGVEESEVTWFLPVLAWAYLETGAIDEAEEIVTEVLRRARGSGNQVALADALWVAGKIAAGRRRWDEARQLFEGGIVLNRDNSFYWAEIRTTFEYGLMQVSAGETDGGRELIEGALRSFRRLGAVPYIARAEQALALL